MNATIGLDPAQQKEKLLEAAHSGNVEEMRLVIQSGADLNASHPNGTAAIHIASNNNHVEIVKLLLEAGVNVNQKGAQGTTPLLFALVRRDGDTSDRSGMVALLLAAGADPNATNEQGIRILDSALSFAMAPGGLKIFKLLVEAGAELDVPDTLGNTPLHRATYDIHEEIVSILLDAGADVKKRNKYGETPAAVAENRAKSFPADSSYTSRLITLAALIKSKEKPGLFSFRRPKS